MHTALIALEDAEAREALLKLVEGPAWQVTAARSCTEARRRFPGRAYDIVFTEVGSGDGHGWSLATRARHSATLVAPPDDVLLDGSLPGGFQHRIAIPFDPVEVQRILERVCPNGDARAPESADRTSEPCEDDDVGTSSVRLIGRSPAMLRMQRHLRCMGPAQAPVLITGETGCGKELAARRLHELSPRRRGPFVAINCGALVPTLMESQLFGHDRGSFTGAARRHRGVFERADGGTVFLDEITEMPVDLQVKLLRVLEQGEFYRTGGEELLEADFRTVAATNRDPVEATKAGLLRPDLFFRLSVLRLEVPPLRERREDLELLASAFLEEVASEEGAQKTLAAETLARLQEYSWPGNVRELRSAIYTAYLMAEGTEITPDALPAEVLSGLLDPPGERARVLRVPLGTSIKDAQRRHILALLDETDGDKARAAEILGVSLKTIYNRLNSYRASAS